jgi:hypothetical protein
VGSTTIHTFTGAGLDATYSSAGVQAKRPAAVLVHSKCRWFATVRHARNRSRSPRQTDEEAACISLPLLRRKRGARSAAGIAAQYFAGRGERTLSCDQIATQAQRLGAIEPPPFLTHRAEVEGLESREPIRDVAPWRGIGRSRRSQHIMGQRTRGRPLPRGRAESLGAIAGGRVRSRPPPFHATGFLAPLVIIGSP